MELGSDAETFAICQHLECIAYAINHRVIGIVEQSELEFNHVFILCIESCNIHKTLEIADLISLLNS